nr:hypothetical protein [Conexibacter sp. SYSU D00693]
MDLRAVAAEARAEDRVSLVVEQRLQEARDVVGVVLEVGVLDDDEVARGGGEALADRGALAAVDVAADDLDPRVPGGELLQDAQGAVGRGVVDDDELTLDRTGRLEQPGEDGGEVALLVEDRDDDAQARPGRRRAGQGFSSPRSARVMRRMSSSKDVSGFQPRTFSAFA